MRGLNFRLGLAPKILAVGGIPVLGLALVAAVYFFGENSLARYQSISDQTSAISAVMDKMSVRFLQMRRAEKDFLLRDDESYVKRHGELANQAGEDVNKLKTMLEAGQYVALVKNAADINAGFDTYVKHFRALADAKRKLGLNADSGLQGSLRQSVHEIEKSLGAFDEPRLNAGMLTMRRHEKDFILRRDTKYGDELKKAAASFSETLNQSNLPQAAKEDIA